MGYVLAAVLWLAPQLGLETARSYAVIIHKEARRHHVDPLLVAAIIHVESSWNTRARSVTADWGLMQVHVSATTNPGLRGREAVLLKPAVGIRYGVRTFAMWRRWHRDHCPAGKHPAWGHYQWGYKVRNLEWSEKVRKLYHGLRDRFRRHTLVAFEGV